MRIVSLLASGTEIVFALGLGDQLVAISHECDYPPEALHKPRISRPLFEPSRLSSRSIDTAVREAMASRGAVYELDESLLHRLQPDLVIAQAVCEVCAVPTTLAQLAVENLGNKPTVLSLDAHSMYDILQSIAQIGAAVGEVEGAGRCVESLRGRISDVRRRVAGAEPVRVLAIEWLDPPFVPGHWVPEMIELAGGSCLVGGPGEPSREVRWPDLTGLDPDVLVVMPCGYGLERSREEADRQAQCLREVAPRAVGAGRAFVVDGSSYFNRSGPRVVDGVEILAALLHPGLLMDYDLSGKAAAWD
jgi:iron complex transport system substrate-binding protein